MNRELYHYLKNFVSHTLGVKTILTNDAKNSSTTNSGPQYLVYVENLNSYNESELELLNKMIAALKIDSTSMIVSATPSSVTARGDSRHTLYLLDNPQNESETYSPRILMDKPELKRKAWNDLKRFLSQS